MIIGISGKIGSGKDTVGKIIQALTFKDARGHKSLYEAIDWVNNERKQSLDDNNPNNFQIKKFAYKLKQIVSILTGCTVEQLESQEFKNQLLSEEWNYAISGLKDKMPIDFFKDDEIFNGNPDRFIKKYTYRDLLQKIGTEAMRGEIHQNIWVNALFSEYKYIPKIGQLSNPDMDKDYPNWIITDMRFPNEYRAIEDREGITIRLQRKTDTHDGHESETALDLYEFDYIINNDGTIENLILEVKEILIREKILND